MHDHKTFLMFGGLLLSVLIALLVAPSVQADCGHLPVDPDETNDWTDDDDWNDDEGDDWDDDDWDDWDDESDAESDEEDAWVDWEEIDARSRIAIREPNQTAVMAWNQREQILVLTTELKGSRSSKMMEIMPLPSRPTVTKGDPELFKKTLDLFNSKQRRPTLIVGKGPPAAGGEIIETIKIGYHNIAIARVVNPTDFVSWADEYVRRQVGPNARTAITRMGKRVITQYLRDGYKYWVFDLIEPDTKLQPHVAIQYRFKTDYLYYPLRITRTLGVGNTRVQLLVLTDRLLTHFRGVRHNMIDVPQPAVTVSPDELRELNTEIADLFGGRPVKLRLWQIEGPIQSFNGDVQASNRPVRRIRFN